MEEGGCIAHEREREVAPERDARQWSAIISVTIRRRVTNYLASDAAALYMGVCMYLLIYSLYSSAAAAARRRPRTTSITCGG